MTTSRIDRAAPDRAPDYKDLVVDQNAHVAVVRLNRPDHGNALTQSMSEELSDAIVRCDADPETRVIVITGNGRHFCVGADMSPGAENRFAWLRAQDRDRASEAVQRSPRIQPWGLATPIIAAINGSALGVGATLPLQWDIRIVAKDARIGFLFTRRGVVPEANSTWLLPRLVGASRAADLLLTGRIFSGQEALEMGLAAQAVAAADVLDVALEVARDIAVNASPSAVANTKRLMYEFLRTGDREAAWREETSVFEALGTQPDAAEGVAAFLQKRTPQWSSVQPTRTDGA